MSTNIKKVFLTVVFFLFFGCSDESKNEGVILYGDISSYSDFDVLNDKYSFYDVKTLRTSKENTSAKVAYTKYKYFENHAGTTSFYFLNDKLVEVHFVYDDITSIIDQYFPLLREKGTVSEYSSSVRYSNGDVKYWRAHNQEIKKDYIGVSDVKLEEEYMEARY